MALVDSKYRFIWANCGIPGNTHDSLIFQSTNIYKWIVNGDIIPDFNFVEDGVKINPIILGDSAFEFRPWIMKPYTNSVLTKEQRNYNYRLSRARMVIEGALGQLKGRRKCESTTHTARIMALAAIVLHNMCIEMGDVGQKNWDLRNDASTNKERPRELVRDMLHMRSCSELKNKNPTAVRNKLRENFWEEHESGNVF